MLTTHAWCNPNQILPHYPQNCEVTQQALLPAILQEPKHTGRPRVGPRALQLILAIGFYAGEKNNRTTFLLNGVHTTQPPDNTATIMSLCPTHSIIPSSPYPIILFKRISVRVTSSSQSPSLSAPAPGHPHG